MCPPPTLACAEEWEEGPHHSLALLAPMGPHLHTLHLQSDVPVDDLATLLTSFTALTELHLKG